MPPYRLSPVIPEDRETISTIFCRSYQSDGYFKVQYPGMPIDDLIAGFTLRFPAGNLSKANSWHYKLLDAAENDKPVAYARWILPETLFEKLSDELHEQGGTMGVEAETKEDLLRYTKERQQGYDEAGNPFGMNMRVPDEAGVELRREEAKISSIWEHSIELDALNTLPEFERKGAASALLEWGVQLADREGMRIRLRATPKGIGLYKKFGFEILGKVTLDLTRWGGEGDHTYYEMGRVPESPKP